MSLFRKKKESIELAPITASPVTNTETELATIQVPDIKQYLVDEYERSKKMENRIQELEEELDASKEMQLKYDATLVTLQEFEDRLKRRDRKIDELKQQLASKKDELKRAYDEVNTFKIQISRAAIDKDEIKNEITATINMSSTLFIESYEKIKNKTLTPIMENIIYEGMHKSLDRIISGEAERKE